ncbi:MAG: hypothetical protein AB1439_03940 [candidate division FCPU426 bacterium]
MLDYKATDITFLKKLFIKAGGAREREFLDVLTAEEAEVYQHALPVSWVDSDMNFAIVRKALPILYPSHRADFGHFGYELAGEDFGGIYKILIRIVSVEYVVASMEKFWGTFNRKGLGSGRMVPGTKQAVLTVTQYPDMAQPYLELLSGYLQRLFEMIGLKNVRTEIDAQDREALKCLVSWD